MTMRSRHQSMSAISRRSRSLNGPRRGRRRVSPRPEALEDRKLLSTAGDLDPTFGVGGIVVTSLTSRGSDGASAVLLQPDGKIVAVGDTSDGKNADWALARYLDAGTPDGPLPPAVMSQATTLTTAAVTEPGAFGPAAVPAPLRSTLPAHWRRRGIGSRASR
jgi:hypothetical protein